MADSRTALQNGELGRCLDELKKEIRTAPTDAEKRVFLFQLYSVIGDWDKAQTQLDVCRDLSSKHSSMAQTYEQVLQCERLRSAVFKGTQSPTILGEPSQWIGLLQQALKLAAANDWSGFSSMQVDAFEQANATPGKIYLEAKDAQGEPSEGIPFEWIADADMRFGPVLEVIVNGRYFWIPIENIESIEIEKPVDLRDLVWVPARFYWKNQGEAVGFIPTRYPGSEQSADDHVRLAKITSWEEPTEGVYIGSGMRTLSTDSQDFSIAEIRRIVFENVEDAADSDAAN
ncbi:MAG: type VI secretion system protein ImpE [Mariniblastus sp.]|jgi:type VI secretion system protein ImpE